MTITPHLLAGAAVATATANPIVAFLLGFISHFVLDAIPHVDPGTFHNVRVPGFKKEINLETVHAEDKPWPLWIYVFAIGEFIFGVGLILLLFRNKPNFAIILVGAFGGIFEDITDNPIFNFTTRWPIVKQFHWLHHRVHHDLAPEKWFWGLPSQIIIIGGSLWYLLRF